MLIDFSFIESGSHRFARNSRISIYSSQAALKLLMGWGKLLIDVRKPALPFFLFPFQTSVLLQFNTQAIINTTKGKLNWMCCEMLSPADCIYNGLQMFPPVGGGFKNNTVTSAKWRKSCH